jgi:hypothetical protein
MFPSLPRGHQGQLQTMKTKTKTKKAEIAPDHIVQYGDVHRPGEIRVPGHFMSEPHPTFTFLLGSGVSWAAGLPNVQTLSCAVASSVSGAEARLLEVIRLLSAATHGDGRDSYEDWYFVADQIAQHEGGNFENAGLLPLMERLRYTSVAE